MNQYRASERGASLTATLLGLLVAGIFLAVGFKLYSPYWEHGTIASVVEGVSTDLEELKKPVGEIRRDIDRRFRINQVSLPERDDLKIELKEGVLYFDLAYERRVPMFYNVDAVVKFEEHYEAIKP